MTGKVAAIVSAAASSSGKWLAALVEGVPRLLVRQQDAPAGRERDAAGLLARYPPGAIEREHRARRGRAAGGEGSETLGSTGWSEQRIGEHLPQPRLELPLLAAGEGGEVHLQSLGELDQQASGDRALLVLDQVEVAGGDAEARGEGLLASPVRCGAGGRCGL